MDKNPQEAMDYKVPRLIFAVFIVLLIDGMCLQMLSLSLPVLMNDFNISKVLAGTIGTNLLVGMGVGGFIAGWLADRIGRVKTTSLFLLVFSVMNCTVALIKTYLQFSIISFLIGVGISALYSISTLMVAEYVPTGRRTTILGTLQAGWSVGYIIAAVSSTYILPTWGWRPMFLISLVPAAISFYLLWGLKEPPSFMVSRQATGSRKRSIWRELLSDKTARNIFILWFLTLIALQFGYYGATTWIPSYLVKDLGIELENMGWYVAGTYSAMVLGKIATGFLADVFGRRLMWSGTALVTAVILPLIIEFATPSSVVYLMPLFGLFYGGPYAILATYISESFPTQIRGTAVSSANALGRIGSMLSPLLIGVLAESYSIGYGIALLGIMYAVAGLIPGLFIKEKLYDPKAI
jgi:AAHS family cis,cis-muconate transporter-like MFS transporter